MVLGKTLENLKTSPDFTQMLVSVQAGTGQKGAHTRDTHVCTCMPTVHMDRAGSHPSGDFATLMPYVLGNMKITLLPWLIVKC